MPNIGGWKDKRFHKLFSRRYLAAEWSLTWN